MAHFTALMTVAKTKAEAEEERRYYAALELVGRIDEELRRATRHYRDRTGRLLTSLDEVVWAILSDNLILAEAEVRCSDVEQATPAPAQLYQ